MKIHKSRPGLFMIMIFLIPFLSACGTNIDELVPSAGVFGTEVTIKGSKFTGYTTIDFNGITVPSSNVISSSDTELIVLVPSGATTGRVHVVTPEGTGESPYDFTVVTKKYAEIESNNSFQTSNPVNLNDHITGTLNYGDTDWFKINSGPSGPWGYTLEFSTKMKNLPSTHDLRVSICYKDTSTPATPIPATLTHSYGISQIAWTSFPPNTELYLEVVSVGSGSWPGSATYNIHISRIPIKDAHEPNDDHTKAKSLIFNSNITNDNSSYLCNIFNPKTSGYQYIGFKDYYSIPKPNVKDELSVVVLFAGLKGTSNSVYVYLLDETGTQVDYNYGDNQTVQLNHTVSSVSSGTGNWYIMISNTWNEDVASGEGPAPLSCKRPYGILVGSNQP